MLYFIGWSLFLIFFRLFLGFEIIGRENVPKKGAFIFASNHISYLDPILLGTSVYRSLNYMAKEDLFKGPVFGWTLRKLHVFPVKRDDSNLRAIKESLNILKEGKPLVIFPEGIRSEDRNLRHGKPGIGFIVSKVQVPVVPAYITGSFDALPKGIKTLKRHPVKVYIGKTITFDRTNFSGKNKDTYQNITDEIMHNIAKLKELYGTN